MLGWAPGRGTAGTHPYRGYDACRPIQIRVAYAALEQAQRTPLRGRQADASATLSRGTARERSIRVIQLGYGTLRRRAECLAAAVELDQGEHALDLCAAGGELPRHFMRKTRNSKGELRSRCGCDSARAGNPTAVVNDGGAPDGGISVEAVETLVWLAKSKGIDHRRYRIVNRLRSLRDSDHFATLPEDLRERVREVVADAER